MDLDSKSTDTCGWKSDAADAGFKRCPKGHVSPGG